MNGSLSIINLHPMFPNYYYEGTLSVIISLLHTHFLHSMRIPDFPRDPRERLQVRYFQPGVTIDANITIVNKFMLAIMCNN